MKIYMFFCLSGCRHIRLSSSNKVEERQLYRPIAVLRAVILETPSDRRKKERRKKLKGERGGEIKNKKKQQRGSEPLEVVTDGSAKPSHRAL